MVCHVLNSPTPVRPVEVSCEKPFYLKHTRCVTIELSIWNRTHVGAHPAVAGNDDNALYVAINYDGRESARVPSHSE